MKKLILTMIVGSVVLIQPVFATNLTDVYQQALKSDPAFEQAYAQEMSTAEAVPENRAALLPSISYLGEADWARQQTETSAAAATARSRAWDNSLTLTQSVFNFTNWKNLSSARDSVKAANATYNVAAQDLMSRTTQAYFAVLEAQEVLRYTSAEKRAFQRQSTRAKEGFKVGVNTITDVYNARAAYDGSVAAYVSAKNSVDNAKEDLRAITGVAYPRLSVLGKIPLVSPAPNNVNQWVTTAARQNWTLTAARFTTLAAHETIWAKRGGHMPTVDFTAQYQKDYTRTYRGGGYTRLAGPSASVDVNVPIFSGGSVTSSVRKAIADYEVASSAQEKTTRDVNNSTRKAFLAVMADVSKVKADKQAIVSNQSSLKATEEGYSVGTRTMVDVLDAQKALYNAQTTWAQDRYDYINQSVALKEAAGTLKGSDLKIINGWLISPTWKSAKIIKNPAKKVTKKQATKKKAVKTYYYLQVGVYSNNNAAKTMKGKVDAFSNAICRVYKAKLKGKTIYRVQVGPLSTQSLANSMSQAIQKHGLPKPIVIKKP